MQIREYEKKIKKEIDSNLSIRLNPNAPDVAGVYWKEVYLGVALPSGEIMDKQSQFHMDYYGVPFRGVHEADRDIQTKLRSLTPQKLEKIRRNL